MSRVWIQVLILLALSGCTVAIWNSKIVTHDSDSHNVDTQGSTNSRAHSFDVDISPR